MKPTIETIKARARKVQRQRGKWKRKAEALARAWDSALYSLGEDGMPFDRVSFRAACNEARHELWGPP